MSSPIEHENDDAAEGRPAAPSSPGRAAAGATGDGGTATVRTVAGASALARTIANGAGTTAHAVTDGVSAAARVIAGWLRHRYVRRTAVVLAVGLVSLVGVVIGILLGGRTETDVGPFRAEMSILPSVVGDTEIRIPPLGSLHVDSHDGPFHLRVQLGALDQGRTQALIDDPSGISRAGESAVAEVTDGLLQLGLRTLGAAVAATLLLSALVFRNVRRVAGSGLTALAISVAGIGVAAGSARPDAIEEPRYEGLLVNAPAVVGDARRIADNYDRYAAQLQALVSNVSRIYSTVSALPIYEPAGQTTRLLHVSDLHLNPAAWSVIRTVVAQFEIDVVVDTGDITDWGSTAEAQYVAAIAELGVPYVYIRGNHDSTLTAAALDRVPNTTVLDNAAVSVAGLRIAGISDPRFTPDKTNEPAGPAAQNAVPPETRNGQELATTIRGSTEPVDLALVHDPAAAGPLSGTCPLVLAGHTHRREVRLLDRTPGGIPTRLMVQGSTGGAGLRGLEAEQPMPLALSVLYFDEQRVLKAYDDIRVGGTGQAQVTLERKVVDDPAGEPSPSSVPSAGPNGSGTDPGRSESGGDAGTARSSAPPAGTR